MNLDEIDNLIGEAALAPAVNPLPTPVEEASQGPIQILNPTPKLLFNRTVPTFIAKKELPHQRAALEMAAKGFTAKEISRVLGVTPVTIQNALLQPNAQEDLVKEIHRIHSEDQRVVEVIKQSVVKAIQKVAEILDDPKAKASEKIAAANLILERRYGKANTPINRNTDVDLNNIPDSELSKHLSAN